MNVSPRLLKIDQHIPKNKSKANNLFTQASEVGDGLAIADSYHCFVITKDSTHSILNFAIYLALDAGCYYNK